jgi:hypothetical protein
MIIHRVFETLTAGECRKLASGEWVEVDRHDESHTLFIEIPDSECECAWEDVDWNGQWIRRYYHEPDCEKA